MKRNKLMVAAALLLALTMISTSSFSGVLAKYIVSDGTTDTARVAKFGVVLTASGDLFGDTYGGTSAGNVVKQTWTSASQAYVTAAQGTNIIAPGTKNDKGMTFAIKGTPEVSTKVTVDAVEDNAGANIANTDIFLKSGNYSIMVPITKANTTITGDNFDTFYKYNEGAASGKSGTFAKLESASDGGDTIYKKVELTKAGGGLPISTNSMTEDYYPIKWKVNNGSDLANVAGVLSEVQTALGGATSPNTPNHEYNASARVTWTWDFGNVWADGNFDSTLAGWENTSLTDLEDTILGQMMTLAAGSTDFKIASGSNEVLYASVPAATDSANNVNVAYVDTTTGVPANAAAGTVVACLTATFGARVTVEQVTAPVVAAP